MSELSERLELLGLAQYHDALVSEGFDSWETILDITESDLNALKIKLGHRRKLQRAILETRGTYPDRAHPLYKSKSGNYDAAYRSDDSGDNKGSRRGDAASNTGVTTSTKRKYRRHPKADEHAPERPPSAYVIFSNQMREELKGKELSFTEIAKVVGERWQTLSTDAREAHEREANTAKEKYYAELAEYKRTPQYAEYQDYLKEFKAKHAPAGDGKRSKTESDDFHNHGHATEASDRRRPSHNFSEGLAMRHQARAGSSPPPQYVRVNTQVANNSIPPHPSHYPYAQTGSPRMLEQYSPMSTSPRSAFHRDFPEPNMGGSSAAGLRDRPLEPHVAPAPAPLRTFPSNSSASPASATPPGTTPANGPIFHAQEHSRRAYRDSPTLPSLVHEDTTLSSDSARTSISNTPRANLLPSGDSIKAQRMLPQPLSTAGYTNSAYDPKVSQTPVPAGSPDARLGASSLAVLLQASEMARNNDLQLQHLQHVNAQHPQMSPRISQQNSVHPPIPNPNRPASPPSQIHRN